MNNTSTEASIQVIDCCTKTRLEKKDQKDPRITREQQERSAKSNARARAANKAHRYIETIRYLRAVHHYTRAESRQSPIREKARAEGNCV